MNNRSMVDFIKADGFYSPQEATRIKEITSTMNFQPTKYGLELPNFNMIPFGIEPLLSSVVGERVMVDHARSGKVRKPLKNLIYFEDFNSLNEWCFIVALEKTTLNFYHHISDPTMGEYSPVDARTALDGTKFNYSNLFEWYYHTNILMNASSGIFIRPWVFHNFDDSLVQYFRLISDRKFRILVIGKDKSRRDTVCKHLEDNLDNSGIVDSAEERQIAKDIDHSDDGDSRHAYRLLQIARGKQKLDSVIINFSARKEDYRRIISPDILIWVDSEEHLDEEPKSYDIKITDTSSLEEMIRIVKSKRMSDSDV